MFVLTIIHNSYLESWKIAKQLKPQSPEWETEADSKGF